MKNKIPGFVAVAIMYVPFIGIILYQIIKNFNHDVYLLLIALACVIGAYFLTILAFVPIRKKSNIKV